MQQVSVIRYPGSKAKLAKAIISLFPKQLWRDLFTPDLKWDYREPFFGAGAVGFRVLHDLERHSSVWLNDIDPGMVALWETVRTDPVALMSRIFHFVPSADAFYQFKAEDGRTDLPAAEMALRKLALHRLSYSGLGAKSGGPLGGKTQGKSEYNVQCRWTPETMKKNITRLHARMSVFKDIRITCGDFAPLIETATDRTFVYLDPPYYEKGAALYKHSMSEVDHERLAGLLRECPAHWLLSYDDHPRIRELYSWATIHPLEVKYTMAKASGQRPKNKEIAITRNAA